MTTTTTASVATTVSGTGLVATILYFASKNGYGDMPPFIAVELAGLVVAVAHAAVHVVPRLKIWQRWFSPVAPGPTTPTA